MSFAGIIESVERNAARIGRIAGKALLATAVTAGEFALEAKALSKIGEGIDDDTPPTFGQSFAAFGTALVGTGVQMLTMSGGLLWALAEVDEWDSGDEIDTEDESEE